METNKLYLFRVNGWTDPYYGIVYKSSPDWVVIRHFDQRFNNEGFAFIRRKYIQTVISDKYTETLEMQIKKSQLQQEVELDIELTSLESVFDYIYKNSILLTTYQGESDLCFVGTINRLTAKSFYMKPLAPNGAWENDEYLFRFESVRIIEIMSDYNRSMMAYLNRNPLSTCTDVVSDITMKNWHDNVQCAIKQSDNEWIMGIGIYIDYIIDGLYIICKKNIEDIESGRNSCFKADVITSKGIDLSDIKAYGSDLINLRSPLKSLCEKGVYVEIYVKKEHSFYVGQLISIDSAHIQIKCVDNYGNWLDEMTNLPVDDIYIIAINTNYLKTLFKNKI